ncbi:MAG: hypothetical protein AAFW74_10945, partial [Pseudomonadota bacterium]
ALYKVLGARGDMQEVGETRGFRDAIAGVAASVDAGRTRGTVLRNNWRQLFQTGSKPISLFVPDENNKPAEQRFESPLAGMHTLLTQQVFEFPDEIDGNIYRRGPLEFNAETGHLEIRPELRAEIDRATRDKNFEAANVLEADNILAPLDEIFRFSNFFTGQNLSRLVSATNAREPGGSRLRYDPAQRERAVMEALPYYMSQVLLQRANAGQFGFDEHKARERAWKMAGSVRRTRE